MSVQKGLRETLVGVAGRVGQGSRVSRLLRGDRRRDRLEHERLRTIFAATLRSDANCVDVGANVGDVARMLCAAAPRGRHIAYEPIPSLAARLARELPGVDVRQLAVSDGRRTETFTHVVDAPALSALGEHDWHPGLETELLQVELVDLDSDLPDGYVPALLKFDVEGQEALAIKGASETILRHRPLLIFEHGYADWAGDLFDLLTRELRMEIFDLEGSGPYDGPAFRSAVRDGPQINFMARPEPTV